MGIPEGEEEMGLDGHIQNRNKINSLDIDPHLWRDWLAIPCRKRWPPKRQATGLSNLGGKEGRKEGVRGMFLLHNTSSTKYMRIFPPYKLILTPTGCLIVQFNSDTNYLEFAQTPQIKGSIPQDFSCFRPQSQVPGCHLYFWPTKHVSQILPQVW